LPASDGSALRELLGYPEDEAGGIMTSALVVAKTDDTVKRSSTAGRGARARRRPRCGGRGEQGRPPGGDVTLLTILLTMRTSPDTRISSLLGDEDVVTVARMRRRTRWPVSSSRPGGSPGRGGRRRRPIGRILADDVLDALVPTKGRFHFPAFCREIAGSGRG
jgi:hypothetical protein